MANLWKSPVGNNGTDPGTYSVLVSSGKVEDVMTDLRSISNSSNKEANFISIVPTGENSENMIVIYEVSEKGA